MACRQSSGCAVLGMAVAIVVALGLLAPYTTEGSDRFDVVSGVIEAPMFKGKTPLERLTLAADLLRANKLKHSDMSFPLLDWADQYLREPTEPLERLQRWATLTNEDKFSNLRIPRDFLNRMLLAEYLVNQTEYLKFSPYEKLALLGKLEQEKLVDWSVALAYARIYAGGVIVGSKDFKNTSPSEALRRLKELQDAGLVGWHYRVPSEGVLAAEALALDGEYQRTDYSGRLRKLEALEKEGLISSLTRKELEKLPAWRLLVDDPSFLRAAPAERKDRILRLKNQDLISGSTYSDLMAVFGPLALASPSGSKPTPVPRKATPQAK